MRRYTALSHPDAFMNGSSPPPPPPRPPFAKSPKAVRRRRPSNPVMPWARLGLLGLVYIVIGLVLSIPAPPPWVWLGVAIAIPLLAIGLTPSIALTNKKHRTGLLSYLGGLFMVVALSVALNYIGSDQSLDNLGFSAAVLGLALLTLLSVVLTAATAAVTAQAGARLMVSAQYWRSVTIVVVTCFAGLCIGGLVGLSLVALP